MDKENTYIMEYNSAKKKDKLMTFLDKSLYLKTILLSETNITYKFKSHVVSLV